MNCKALFLPLLLASLFGCGSDEPSSAPNVDHGCLAPAGCLALGAEPAPRVQLSVSPVEAETPFDVTVQFDETVSDVQVRIEGASMFMGYIPVVVTPTDRGYRGSAMVGACTTARMDWRLLIEWRAGGLALRAHVDFSVLK